MNFTIKNIAKVLSWLMFAMLLFAELKVFTFEIAAPSAITYSESSLDFEGVQQRDLFLKERQDHISLWKTATTEDGETIFISPSGALSQSAPDGYFDPEYLSTEEQEILMKGITNNDSHLISKNVKWGIFFGLLIALFGSHWEYNTLVTYYEPSYVKGVLIFAAVFTAIAMMVNQLLVSQDELFVLMSFFFAFGIFVGFIPGHMWARVTSLLWRWSNKTSFKTHFRTYRA